MFLGLIPAAKQPLDGPVAVESASLAHRMLSVTSVLHDCSINAGSQSPRAFVERNTSEEGTIPQVT